jgi:putative PIN family toxin of toxin-antitoxin system
MEGMRIFLDANILISGILFKGKEHELLIKNSTILFITSDDVLDEIKTVINQKFPESIALVDAFLSMLNITVVKRKDYINTLNEHTIVRDRNDRHILAAAVHTKVDYIVTGDNDLLILKTYKTIKIIPTKKMLSFLK